MSRGPLTGPRMPPSLKPGLLYSHRLADEVRRIPAEASRLWAGVDEAGAPPPPVGNTFPLPLLRYLARWVLLLGAVVLVLGCLPGCGGGGGSDEGDDPDKTVQPVDCQALPELCR